MQIGQVAAHYITAAFEQVRRVRPERRGEDPRADAYVRRRYSETQRCLHTKDLHVDRGLAVCEQPERHLEDEHHLVRELLIAVPLPHLLLESLAVGSDGDCRLHRSPL